MKTHSETKKYIFAVDVNYLAIPGSEVAGAKRDPHFPKPAPPLRGYAHTLFGVS